MPTDMHTNYSHESCGMRVCVAMITCCIRFGVKDVHFTYMHVNVCDLFFAKPLCVQPLLFSAAAGWKILVIKHAARFRIAMLSS